MNIKEAKEQIKNAMTAYFSKDELGLPLIPAEKQRPVFLLGAPGIGKTAIMEQIAKELDVALVSYSMTHHTRQSALGLPYIETKTYGGKEYKVSEYTMSEIIASVYDTIEATGKKEGILFLDEINCVSETLTPSMLQFLQYKTFGRHKVPDGWIVVTAGNPPEFNSAVREFDIATLDRIKTVTVEPDYGAWREYAVNTGVHPAVLCYLDIKKTDFYRIETTVDGKRFVTARGWSDLSDMIKLYEKNGIAVDEKLVSQYINVIKTAGSFAVYYDLFNKYRSDYGIESILDGKADESIKAKASAAEFDERLALVSLLIDGVTERVRLFTVYENALSDIIPIYKSIRAEITSNPEKTRSVLSERTSALSDSYEKKKIACSLSRDGESASLTAISMLKKISVSDVTPDRVKTAVEGYINELKTKAAECKETLSNLFAFADGVFGEGNETLMLVTELTANENTSRFISRYGCPEYFSHSKELMFFERQKEIISSIGELEI